MKEQIEMFKEPTKFYRFHQNNSGGRFFYSKDLGENVYIEAFSPLDANKRAEELGIYFDGVVRGQDCSCCGDRWYDKSELDEPEESVEQIIKEHAGDPNARYSWDQNPKQVVIHYMDGRVEWHNREWRFGSRRKSIEDGMD